MIIEAVRIRNFRSVLDETLYCENLTALVGTNGSGKSSFLQGLNLFYDSTPTIDPEDFYDGNTTTEIIVTVTYKDLSLEAKDLFAAYIQGDALSVERVFVWNAGNATWKYHGTTLQCPRFQDIRDGLAVKDRGKTAKEAYEGIRAMVDFDTLPPWSNLGAVSENLKQWEADHPDQCIRQRDDGQFFGFKEVARGYLGRFTRFLFIPAVRDASGDSAEARGSVLTELMDLVIRSALASNEEIMRFKEETQKRYAEIIEPVSRVELDTLANKLTETLKIFVSDTDVRVDLRWLPSPAINIPLPQADVRVIEDGYLSTVTRKGHGLQRAFILTILQHLALAQSMSSSIDKTKKQKPETQELRLPDFVLAIEEPELYQHPNRQRHLAKILLQLASGTIPGVAEKTQVIYATHSPLFVGIDRINQIRLLRKTHHSEDKPKITKIVSTNLDKVAEILWNADDKPGQHYVGETLLPRLQALMTPWMSEGFFAEVVVLVEGEDDRAAILGIATTMGYDLESSGFSVIPCGGKTSLDRPAVIFQQLDIPVYVIWDGDKGEANAKPEDNHRLLRLMGQPVTDWPSQIHDQFTCFENKLETTLQNEIGNSAFDEWLHECQDNYGIPKRRHAIKNPLIVASLLQKAQEHECHCNTLENTIKKILVLKK